MAEITISPVHKHSLRELSSGDFLVQFHVDRTNAAQLLSLLLVSSDQPLTMTLADTGEVKDTDQQEYRNKLIARIHILANEIGYSDEARRTAYKSLTGKTTLVDMDDNELETVEQEFHKESQPPLEEA